MYSNDVPAVTSPANEGRTVVAPPTANVTLLPDTATLMRCPSTGAGGIVMVAVSPELVISNILIFLVVLNGYVAVVATVIYCGKEISTNEFTVGP